MEGMLGICSTALGKIDERSTQNFTKQRQANAERPIYKWACVDVHERLLLYYLYAGVQIGMLLIRRLHTSERSCHLIGKLLYSETSAFY
jgi:hypothetical protein